MYVQDIVAKATCVLVMTLLFSLTNAQPPLKFNFQAAARYNTGVVMSDMDIRVRINIRNESENGNSEYSEIRSVHTNSSGMFTMAIGSTGAVFSSGSLKDVNWEGGKKYLQVEIDPKGGENYINLGATQLLSVPFALFSLESADNKNGINVSASNGLSFADSTFQIGNREGDTSARLLNTREIPLKGHSLKLTDGAGIINLSKGLITFRPDSTIMADNAYNDNYYKGGPFIKINPINARQDAVPFLFNRTSHRQFDGTVSPNEVVTWGHNLEGGGRAYIPGLPGIGYSLESNYKPDPKTRFVESHEFYINPQGEQVRLKSYTINTVNNTIDFYHSVDNFSLRKPKTAKEYFYVANNGTMTSANWQTNVGHFSIIASDDKSVVLDNALGEAAGLYFTRWGSITLPGMILAGGNNRFTANTFPEKDYAYSMGTYANRWLNVASYKFSGEKMILKSGWAAFDNISPTATLDIAGEDGFSQLRMRTPYTPTSSQDPKGDVGTTAWDDNFIYIKTQSGWKKSALSSF